MITAQDTITICKVCLSRIKMGELRYNKKYNDFVCNKCFNNIEPIRHIKVKIPKLEKMIHYRCQDCGYTFMRSESFQFGGTCFFCGKLNVEILQYKGQSLLKNINEVFSEDKKD